MGKENAAFIVKAPIQGGWVTSALKTLNSWILVLKERESVSYFMPGETGTDYLWFRFSIRVAWPKAFFIINNIIKIIASSY